MTLFRALYSIRRTCRQVLYAYKAYACNFYQELDTSWYLNQVKNELSNISASHKDWHGAISRFGKVIDKQLTENVSFFTNK